ncbi:MAG: hypothetical protein RIS51_477 [Actinomycetota bacterium]
MRRSRILIAALLFSLFPGVVPAVAAPLSGDYLLTSLEIGSTSLMTRQGGAFDSYATEYVYNIPSADFTSITLEWTNPAGADVDIELNSDGVVRFWNNQAQSSLEIEDQDFCTAFLINGDCPAGSQAPLSEISITVTSEDGENAIVYRIKVVRPLASDLINFSFWPRPPLMGEQTIDGGLPPQTVSSLRGYVQVPDAGTLFKFNYAFGGWQDINDETKVYKPGEFILLDRSITARALWISDVPGLSISVEGEDSIEVDNSSASTLYSAFDLDDPTKINFAITSDSRFQVGLYTYPPTVLLPNGIRIDGVDSSTSARRFLNTNESCHDELDADCSNLFRLEIVAYSPSQQQPAKTVNIILLRRYSPAARPSFRINWTGAQRTDTPVSQGWQQLPLYAPDEFSPSPVHLLTGFTKTIGDVVTEYEPGEFVPILTDQTFEPVFTEVDITPSVNLFGYQLTFDFCANPALNLEFCLSVNGQLYEPADSRFYITLPLVQPLSELADHRQNLEVTWESWPDGDPFITESNLFSMDFRREFWFMEEPVVNENNQLTDEELCTDGDCHEAFVLELENLTFDNIAFNYDVFFILNSNPAQQVTINFANDATAAPFNTVTQTRGWMALPSLNARTKLDHIATVWTSLRSWEDLEYVSRYPILENDTVYPSWQELFQVRFFNGNDTIETDEFVGSKVLDEYDLDIPESPHEFLGWALTPTGEVVEPDFLIEADADFYAQWDIPIPAPNPPNNNPPAPEPPVSPVTPTPQPPVVVPDTPKPTTTVLISRINGLTSVVTAVPAKYVNKPARIEVRRVVGGKVRYYLVGRAWSHFNKATQDKTKAQMIFSFKLELKPTDVFRVKVSDTQVIRSTGDGKPAWK